MKTTYLWSQVINQLRDILTAIDYSLLSMIQAIDLQSDEVEFECKAESNWCLSFADFWLDDDLFTNRFSEQEITASTTCTTDNHDSVNNLTSSSSSSSNNISTKRKAVDFAEKDASADIMALTTSKSKKQRSQDTQLQEKPELVLYSFPSYDKSDSAIYFPSTFTRLFNGGDFDQLYQLFSSHMDMNCDMNVTYMNAKPNTRNLAEFYAFFIDMFPDMIMCVDSVTVEENRIRAVIYRKYTDVKAIKDGLVRRTKSPLQNAMLQTFLQKERFLSYGLSKKEKKKLKAILKQETDLEVFLRMQMILTRDHASSKFVNLMIITGLETVNPVLYTTSSGGSIS